MGEGTGRKDVSDQLTDEDQLLGSRQKDMPQDQARSLALDHLDIIFGSFFLRRCHYHARGTTGSCVRSAACSGVLKLYLRKTVRLEEG